MDAGKGASKIAFPSMQLESQVPTPASIPMINSLYQCRAHALLWMRLWFPALYSNEHIGSLVLAVFLQQSRPRPVTC